MGKFLVSLRRLDDWFHRQKRVLPWRNDPTVYRVWVSEIMLQQTQVAAVVPYFERFVSRFPTVEDLAQAPQEDVMQLWAGLGYYSRARNLHRAAQLIVQKGRFPENSLEWLEIPGVGRYTAGAILSIAEDQPEPILDGNVERVLARVRRVSRQKGDVRFKARLWRLSEIFVQTAFENGVRPSALNQALMELGATVCTPRRPVCMLCPLQEMCRAFSGGEQEIYPPKKKKKEWVQVQEKMHCLVNPSGKVLLRKRRPDEWRAGLWDLLEEEPSRWGWAPTELGEVETRHVVTRHKIKRITQIWKVAEKSQKIGKSSKSQLATKPHLESEFRWVSIHDPEVPVGSALRRTLKEILSEKKFC